MILQKMVEKIVKNIWRNCGTRSRWTLQKLYETYPRGVLNAEITVNCDHLTTTLLLKILF